MYRYYQPNKKDLKDNHGDCVIRAPTMILDKSWLGVFDDLVPYARELQNDLACRPVYEKYLIDNGFTYVGISNRRGSKRLTVSQFARDHKKGRYFCNLANHVVCVVDGVYYDTWDCGDSCLYGYYAILEDK